MVMKIYKIGTFLSLAVLLFSGSTFAQDHEPLLNFKFNHLSNVKTGDDISFADTGALLSRNLPFADNKLKFSAYDATWTYPWETKNMNIDLGVTLRHLSGSINSGVNGESQYFQEFLPLLHASALFNLPLRGLSAGIEGSHLGLNDNEIFDYRAKISYELRNGFGMQGGWQHQQFSLDNATSSGADYKMNGPFIDFYLNF